MRPSVRNTRRRVMRAQLQLAGWQVRLDPTGYGLYCNEKLEVGRFPVADTAWYYAEWMQLPGKKTRVFK